MKLNSNTVLLNNDNLQQFVSLSESIAKKNEVFNVKHVDINLNQEKGEIKFSSTLPTDIDEKLTEVMSYGNNTKKDASILQRWEEINHQEQNVLNHIDEYTNK